MAILIKLANSKMLNEEIVKNCKYFDTYKCPLKEIPDLMDKVMLISKQPASAIITADEYFEVKEKCDKVCASCEVFESKKTD